MLTGGGRGGQGHVLAGDAALSDQIEIMTPSKTFNYCIQS